MKLLLYCTKAKPYLIQGLAKPMHTLDTTNPFNYNWRLVNKGFSNERLNGKIVAECDYEVEEIEHYVHYEPEVDVGIAVLPEFECDAYSTETLDYFKLLEKSCLNELEGYLKGKNGYAIHIKNLHIFDKPRDLDFYSSNFDYFKKVEKAPQNMMRVWEDQENPRVLISIKPEWLCKILNKEKTIEVRRKVLKEMLK